MPRRVLIVEDDAQLRRLFDKAFSHADFEVTSVASGTEALAYLQNSLPPLVLLDLGIPEPGGLELLKYIRRHEQRMDLAQRVNVIVVTGNAIAENSPEAGLADLFLLKPVEIGQVISMAMRLRQTTASFKG